MNRKIVLLGAALALFALNAHAAEEEKKEKDSPWTTTAGLGFVNTSGNTNTETLVFKFDTAYEIEKWKHEFHFDILNAETDNITTADRKFLTAQSNFKFTPRDYVYGNVTYEDDKFSGFEYQVKLSVGYGRKILDLEKHKLDGEIGPGYRNFKVDNAPDSEDEALIRLAGKYLYKFTDKSDFSQDLIADFGELQDEWRSVTGLRANINDSLSLRLTYTVRYLDKVPPGNVNYDRTTAVTLDYTF